jgi:hypothetical protein
MTLLFAAISRAQSGVTVYYVATAVDPNGIESSYSNEASCAYTQALHHCLLAWVASTSTVNGYNVYKSFTKGGPYTKVNSALITTLSYTDVYVFPSPPTGLSGTLQP